MVRVRREALTPKGSPMSSPTKRLSINHAQLQTHSWLKLKIRLIIQQRQFHVRLSLS